MAIEPEFVRLIKRWIRPMINKYEQGQKSINTASLTSDIKPIQLDDDEDDLR